MPENAEPAKPDSIPGGRRPARPTEAAPAWPQGDGIGRDSTPPEGVSPPASGPDQEADSHRETHFGLNSEGEFHYLPHRLAQRLHVPEDVQVVDPRFTRDRYRDLAQAGRATGAMLVILLLVDSLSDAALAAGLGSSVIILFVHPSSPAARPRALIGGHGLAFLMGLLGAGVLFVGPVGDFLHSSQLLFNASLAVGVGGLIILMAITNTEHPPAAGTVLGVSMEPWDPWRLATIIIAVMLLALLKWLLHRYLRDLI